MPGMGFTMMKRNGWGASLEVKSTIVQSEQMPKDFEPGGLLLFGDDGMPDDIYAFYTLSVVKDFQTRNKQIVPGLIIGIAYTEKTIATNFTPYTSTPCTSFGCSWAVDFGSSNYDYDFKKTKSAGLFLKPKLKYVFSRSAAIESAAWTILTPKGNYYGAELSLLMGRLK